MDFEFDGALIYEGDAIHVVGKGPGRVLDTKPSYFRIKVGGRVRKVSYSGIVSGENFKSVFWKNPVVAIPAKDNVLWGVQRELALDTVNAFTKAVKHQDLIVEAHPEPELAVDGSESNLAALQGMVENIKNGASLLTTQGGTVTDISDAR